ncbi:FecR family protein [Rubrolithibacter danxiaensis]|uniref:FecR family protein n=1 Tax=Rubrolithibacter danxiaensis TaxID=3390805 RepID=UPI003BF79841
MPESEKCFTELMSKKLAGEINSDELRKFEALLHSNASYREEYRLLQNYWQESDIPYENMDTIFERIKRKTDIGIYEEKTISGRKNSLSLNWKWKAAAAVLLLFLSAIVFQKLFLETSESENTLSWKKLATPSSTISKVKLSDGTVITLNSESELKYPQNFSGNTREVYLSGEAFFDVAKDKVHPFIVHSDQFKVKVLGTKFNIKSYPGEIRKEATLINGKIELTTAGASGKSVFLEPKDKIVIEDSKISLTKTDNSVSIAEIAWLENRLEFKNQSFELLANSISRKFGVKIIFKDQAKRFRKYTGNFKDETLNELLFALQTVNPFQYKIQEGIVYIY